MAVKKQSRSCSIAPARARKLSSFSRVLCAGAAFLTAFGAAATAFAGGGHYRGHSGDHHSGSVQVHAGFHGGGHRGHFRGHRRGHNYRRGHHRGHGRIDGGEAALIALGVIGGAILINEAIESDRRRDAYEPRYRGYDPRRDDYYYRRGYPSGAEYDSAYPENYADSGDSGLQRTPTPRRAPEPAPEPSPGAASDPLDDALLGGAAPEPVTRQPASRQDGVSFPVRIAYRECANEARNAAHRDGQIIAMPAEPTRIEQIGPDRVRLTADLTAQPQRGGQYLRVLTCEADRQGVTFLELI